MRWAAGGPDGVCLSMMQEDYCEWVYLDLHRQLIDASARVDLAYRMVRTAGQGGAGGPD